MVDKGASNDAHIYGTTNIDYLCTNPKSRGAITNNNKDDVMANFNVDPTPPAVTPPVVDPLNPNPGGGDEPKPALNADGTPILDANGVPMVLDANGNPVSINVPPPPTGIPLDAEGKPVHEYEVGTEVKLDNGTSLVIDPNGNLVDKDKKVVVTADKVGEHIATLIRNQSLDATKVLEVAAEAFGLNPVNEKGEPLAANSIDDVISYISTAKDSFYAQGRQEAMEDLVNKYPQINQVVNYLALHGTLEGINGKARYADVTIKEDDVEHQKLIAGKILEEKGVLDIPGYIKYLTDAGTLKTTAAQLLKDRQAQEVAEDAQLAQAAAAKEAQVQADTKAYYDALHESLRKGNVGTYSIPEHFIVERDGQKVRTNREEFFNYCSAPVDRAGNTGANVDYSKLTPQERINYDALCNFLLYTKGNLSDLVNVAVGQRRVIQVNSMGKGGGAGFSILKPSDTPDPTNGGSKRNINFTTQ